jgi:hypothetical protein
LVQRPDKNNNFYREADDGDLAGGKQLTLLRGGRPCNASVEEDQQSLLVGMHRATERS